MKNKLNNSTRAWHIQQIQQMDLTKPKRITITDWREKRGLDANALSHVWYKIVGDELGMFESEVKADCKIQFGLVILFNGSSDYAASIAMLLEGCNFWQSSLEQQRKLIEPIAVTSKFNTKEMSEYLEAIQRFYGVQGIVLESK